MKMRNKKMARLASAAAACGKQRGAAGKVGLIWKSIFFVAAGFTLNLTKWQNRKYEFFCSRVKRRLVPYFLLGLLF